MFQIWRKGRGSNTLFNDNRDFLKTLKLGDDHKILGLSNLKKDMQVISTFKINEFLADLSPSTSSK